MRSLLRANTVAGSSTAPRQAASPGPLTVTGVTGRYTIEPIEWDVRYPLHVEPIGRIRRRGGAFHAKLADQLLGSYLNGDAAAEAVWAGYLAAGRSRHAEASTLHGSADRHPTRHHSPT
jgi:hypothetical protein